MRDIIFGAFIGLILRYAGFEVWECIFVAALASLVYGIFLSKEGITREDDISHLIGHNDD